MIKKRVVSIFTVISCLLVLFGCSQNSSEPFMQETVPALQQEQAQDEVDLDNQATNEDEEDKIVSEPITQFTVPKLEVKSFPIPDNDALTFTKGLSLGFNLGNTFDAVVADGVAYQGDPLDIESMWVGIKTKPEMIQKLKDSGFQTLRIPVSWHDHVDENFTIDEAWLSRVQEVVNYAYDIDMNVILNIHHDNETSFLYPSYELQDQSKLYIESIWSQLSERFKEYDHRLIFESMNEPRLKGTPQEWWIDVNSPASSEPLDVINLLNQAFVDVVRASGGNNNERYLMVPSYAASPNFTKTDKFKLPLDSTPNKLILSIHSYTPYNFALADPQDSNSKTSFDHEQFSSTNEIDQFMNAVYENYIQKGIPVVIGEFGARDKDGNTQDRINFAAYYTNAASNRGIPVVWWDNHHFKGEGERFGLLDRYTSSWTYPDIVDALVKYSLK